MDELEMKVNYYILRRILKEAIDIDSIITEKSNEGRLIQLLELIVKLDALYKDKESPLPEKEERIRKALIRAKEVSKVLGI